MNDKLVRGLGFIDATAIVVGSIIGTGIFLKTAIMAQGVGSPWYVLLAWIVAGLLSCAGALTYAELGGLFHQTGGEYVYLREGYGHLPAFLYGWQRFWIGGPGTIAAYAVGAATFMLPVVPQSFLGGRVGIAIAIIIVFTIINCLHVAVGGKLQSVMTILKVFLILFICAGIIFFSQNADMAHLYSTGDGGNWPGFSLFGAAMLAALWAYDGWNNLPMASGEIKNPHRNIPLSLIVGILLVIIVYSLINFAYFYALPFTDILNANSTNFPDAPPVAAMAASTFLGSKALIIFLALAFTFSAVGALHGSVLTNARVPFAMAEDGHFPKKFSDVHSKTRVPVFSVVIQGIWSCVLAMSGTFDQLTDYVVFASWIFYAAVTASVFIFRKRLKDTPRPYKVLGYPFVPAIFILSAIFLFFNTLFTNTKSSVIGLIIILAGLPVYFWKKKIKEKIPALDASLEVD